MKLLDFILNNIDSLNFPFNILHIYISNTVTNPDSTTLLITIKRYQQ
jgi:hypothetical protein